MTLADRIIRWTTAGAVVGVAAVAAVASYEHAYDLVRTHGETGWTARLIPLTVDGLIYASSMVMLDSARLKTPVPALARWLLGLGIVATLAANVAHGLGDGLIGAAVAAWPAVALVGAYELLMWSSAVLRYRGTACPRQSAMRTRYRNRRSSCWPRNLRRTGFPRCAPSALSSMSASHGRSAFVTTWPVSRRRGKSWNRCTNMAYRVRAQVRVHFRKAVLPLDCRAHGGTTRKERRRRRPDGSGRKAASERTMSW
jgi:hypothetical protein